VLISANQRQNRCINTLGATDQRFLVWKITCDTEKHCGWIFGSKEYQSWKASNETILLSILGGPGHSKTSTVAKILKSCGLSLPNDSPIVPPQDDRTVLWFFFSGAADGTATIFLRTIISQLVQQHSCLGGYLSNSRARNPCSSWSWESLWTVFCFVLIILYSLYLEYDSPYGRVSSHARESP
jgi:hypothetical protein